MRTSDPEPSPGMSQRKNQILEALTKIHVLLVAKPLDAFTALQTQRSFFDVVMTVQQFRDFLLTPGLIKSLNNTPKTFILVVPSTLPDPFIKGQSLFELTQKLFFAFFEFNFVQ